MGLAFVFPGQGSQYVGMGKELYENFDEVKRLYDEASDILNYDVAELSFNGPAEELNKTCKTQPSLLVASISACVALSKKGIKPTVVSGHSLGEYSALVVAESLSFKDALKITEIRGKLMQEAVPEGKGLMAAILGLDREVVDEICNKVSNSSIINSHSSLPYYVSSANYNCPGQIVISGLKEAVEEAMKMAKERGAKRTVPLSVSVPSHCKLMEDASRKFEAILRHIEIKDAKIPFVNNIGAKFLSDKNEIRESLVKQLSNAILWEDCIKTISSSGIKTFIEVGPGKVLSGLIKRIEPSAIVFNVEDLDSLTKTVSAIYN